MRKTYDGSAISAESVESVEPIEYVDSIVESSFVNAINIAAVKHIGKMQDIKMNTEAYGISSIAPYIKKSVKDITKPGVWIIQDTSTNDGYALTLYQRVDYTYFYYPTYNIDRICKFYSVKCKRTVPRLIKQATAFEVFESELEVAVSKMTNNAERAGVLESIGKK
jgi:hypothetical protein